MADTTQQGALRDADGALVVVLEDDAVDPLTFNNIGWLVDADGAVVIKEAG